MKLVIAGGGMIVRDVAPHLSRWGWEVEAICVTPRGEERARELAKKCANAAVYTDFSRMLEEAEANVVYIAVPNHLHFDFARQALEQGYHVILEKPICSNIREAEALAKLAEEKELLLFEAITTLYQPNFAILRRQLERIGEVKIVSCNFSQYSSRYDAFAAGGLPPVFDPAQSGGCLMDLNVYNLHWLVGLLGSPDAVRYKPNLHRGVDTSGMLTLEYPGFAAVSIAAKDCGAPCSYVIQGTKGYLMQTMPANTCGPITLHLNSGKEERFHVPTWHRLEAEFTAFARMIRQNDRKGCKAMLDHSLLVCRLMTQARESAGIIFPADEM